VQLPYWSVMSQDERPAGSPVKEWFVEFRVRRKLLGKVRAHVASGALKHISKFGLGNRPAELNNQFGAFFHPKGEATKDKASLNFLGWTPPFAGRLRAITTHHHNFIEGGWVLISAAGKPMTETLQQWTEEGKCGLLAQSTDNADNRGKSWVGGLTAETKAGAHDTTLSKREALGPVSKYATEAFALESPSDNELKACLRAEIARGNARLVCEVRYDKYAIQYDAPYVIQYYGYSTDQLACEADIAAGDMQVSAETEVTLLAFMPGGKNGYMQHANIGVYFNVDVEVEKMKELAMSALSSKEQVDFVLDA